MELKDITYEYLVGKNWQVKELKKYLSYSIRSNITKYKNCLRGLIDHPRKEIPKSKIEELKKQAEDAILNYTMAEAVFAKRVKDLTDIKAKEESDLSPKHKLKKALLEKSDALKALDGMGNVIWDNFD